MTNPDLFGDVAIIGIGVGLLIAVGAAVKNIGSPQGAVPAAGAALGYTVGSTVDSTVGGAYQGYAQPISQGLCSASGGTWVGGTGGTCTNIPGPFGITPNTPVLGGLFGWAVS